MNRTAYKLTDLGTLVAAILIGILLTVVAVAGCSLFSQVEPPIKDCVGRVLDDAAAGMTVTQIVEDAGGPCALDAAAVMAILLNGNASPAVMRSKAYAEATRARNALTPAPGSASAPPEPAPAGSR